MKPQRIALAMTGASGIQYGLRLMQLLLAADKQVYLMLSQPAQVVMAMETDLKAPADRREAQAYFSQLYNAKQDQLTLFGPQQWTAPLASGSGTADAMVVCPCTTGTLAAITTGQSNNLIERAADVMIKEKRQLILMPREMPLSEIHLENMLKLARMGVTIMPPNPGFYFQPQSVDDLVDFIVAKVLDHLQIEHDLLPRWGE